MPNQAEQMAPRIKQALDHANAQYPIVMAEKTKAEQETPARVDEARFRAETTVQVFRDFEF